MTNEHRVELNRLLALPWSFRITHEEGSLLAEIEELPEFIAASDKPEELEIAVWDSLRSLLSSFLASGDRIPEPATPPIQMDPRPLVDEESLAHVVAGLTALPSNPGTYSRVWSFN